MKDKQLKPFKLSALAKKRLLKVQRWLEAGGKHNEEGGMGGFNMVYSISTMSPNWRGQFCGTVCCIAGALVLFGGMRHSKEYTYPYEWISVEPEARKLLGDTKSPAMHPMLHRLFYGHDGDSGFDTPNRSPAKAARVIDHFIKTGVVEWGRLR